MTARGDRGGIDGRGGIDPARDPGLQRERTALSWQRTALSTAMVALLLAFACLRGGFLVGTLIAVGIAVAATVVLFVGRRRAAGRGREGAAGGPARSAWTPLTRVAVIVLVTAVLAAVLVLLVLF